MHDNLPDDPFWDVGAPTPRRSITMPTHLASGLADALKSTLLVWVFTTIGLFLPGMLGWIAEVSSWAAQKGAPGFPDPSNLAYLFVAALTAAFPAAVAGIIRFIENLSGKQILPRTASAPVPVVRRDEAGQGVLYWLLVGAAALFVLYLLAVLIR